MTLTRALAGIAAALLLGGCVPNNVRQDEIAVFDLVVPGATWNAPALQGVDVVAPSWLGNAAIQYRLGYADAARRRTYAESRWVAPPAELIEQALRRLALASASGPGTAGQGALACSLRVELDELVQVFDSPGSSRIVLALRAGLVSRQGQPAANRTFVIERATESADARGGVAATAAAVQTLGGDLAAWLNTLIGEKSALATRCNI